jgi:hypothetical protein
MSPLDGSHICSRAMKIHADPCLIYRAKHGQREREREEYREIDIDDRSSDQILVVGSLGNDPVTLSADD